MAAEKNNVIEESTFEEYLCLPIDLLPYCSSSFCRKMKGLRVSPESYFIKESKLENTIKEIR